MQNLLYDSMIDRIGASKSFLVKKKQTNKQKLPNPPLPRYMYIVSANFDSRLLVYFCH